MTTEKSYKRILTLLVIWGLVFFAFWVRLFYLQVIKYSYYKSEAAKWQKKTTIIPARRGFILDRNGEILAEDVPIDTYAVAPQLLNNPELADSILSYYLNRPRGFLLELLKNRNSFTYIDNNVPKEVSLKLWKALVENRVDGIERREGYKRVYPYKETGAHIIGFYGPTPSGLEAKYDSLLRGTPGKAFVYANGFTKIGRSPAIPGCNIYLTIDIRVQQALEECVKEAVEQNGGKDGMGVVIIPQTGEILALCSYPTFDPNNYQKFPADYQRNRAIVDPFEPGSVFKIVTLALALESNLAKETDTIFCHNGKYVDNKLGLKIRDVHPYGKLTVEDIIVKSSNIGTMLLSWAAPKESLYIIAKNFGFGTKTEVELPGEDGGNLPPPHRWSIGTRANFPFGQGLTATALQIASAYAAIANNGIRIRPYIVQKIVDYTDKEIVPDRRKHLRENPDRFIKLYGTRVTSETTAVRIRKILREVVKRGTGTLADVKGIEVGGKTGTAQKAINGRYSDKVFASFVGLAPIDSPTVVCAIFVDEPSHANQFGGISCAPYVGQLITKINAISNEYIPVHPSGYIASVEDDLRMPDVVMMYRTQAEKLLKWLTLEPKFDGEGTFVISQLPPPNTPVAKNSPVLLRLGGTPQANATRNTMPDLRGLSIREAIQRLSKDGIGLKIIGSGVVKHQDPPPNSPLTERTYCILQCSPE